MGLAYLIEGKGGWWGWEELVEPGGESREVEEYGLDMKMGTVYVPRV